MNVPSLKSGQFPNVPDPGVPGECIKVTFSEDEAKLFAEIVEESLVIALRTSAAGTIGKSATLWCNVFGNCFPGAPAESAGPLKIMVMKLVRRMIWDIGA